MKMKTTKIILLCLTSLLYSGIVSAQSDLEIRKVFEEYGNQKGVIMVDLKGKMLDDYNFSAFKSIIIANRPEAGDFVRKCLAKDQEGAKKVKQVVSSGKVTSIILQLAPVKSTNRLLLFNENNEKPPRITLVYIETAESPDEILKFILKKK